MCGPSLLIAGIAFMVGASIAAVPSAGSSITRSAIVAIPAFSQTPEQYLVDCLQTGTPIASGVYHTSATIHIPAK